MRNMISKYLAELNDCPSPPSPYDGAEDGAEDGAAWFLPQDAEASAFLPAGPRTRPGGPFDPAAWLEAQGLLSGDLAAACLAFGRLDARLDLAGEGMRLRLALQEMADLGWLSGARIGVDRLSLFLAQRIGAAQDAAVLGQLAWGVRRLTGPVPPEGETGWAAGLGTFLGFQGDAVRDLAETMAQTAALHPMTRAALLLHGWKMAGAERAARDIEGAVMAARHAGGIGRGALFLPLALGTAAALRGRGTVAARLADFYRGAEQASLAALMLLDRITAWERHARGVLYDCSGRIPGALVAVFVRWPMVSAAMAETHAGASRAAVQRNLDLMAARGIIREITGQGRYRIWAAAL
ncbi:helix-turn-helix domain-containing protein [Cypionkella sinensis]|uniref:helix-turn-helix domain-containing protein n=1 Tax=Cypionkella sinensis TaxID=1756043 RepID=UPI00362DA84C